MSVKIKYRKPRNSAPPAHYRARTIYYRGGTNTELMLFKIFKNFMKYNNLNLFI